uniref:Putative terminase n=1 Tax=viral metagenome TaxID=1070528 RepID=A0A6M3K3D4_9ZZZZ
MTTKEEIKPIGYTELFTLNKESKAKVVVNVGGAGSSKSHSLAQLFIYKLLNEENKVFGVCRRTFPALRMTSMGLIIDLLKEYGVYREVAHNKTANNYRYGSNIMWFFSIDESDKIKSTNFSYIWIEEANELDWESYIILKLRLRAPIKPGELNQIFISLNPSDSSSWIATKLCGVGQDV